MRRIRPTAQLTIIMILTSRELSLVLFTPSKSVEVSAVKLRAPSGDSEVSNTIEKLVKEVLENDTLYEGNVKLF